MKKGEKCYLIISNFSEPDDRNIVGIFNDKKELMEYISSGYCGKNWEVLSCECLGKIERYSKIV